MYLTHRPTTQQDLDACLPLINNGFAFPPESHPALLSLWRHLIAGRMSESAVIEDHERPPGRRIVGFGMSVFVTDEFADESMTRLPPYQPVHVLERWQQSSPPFLGAEEIARANAEGGVNVVVLHAGWSSDDTEEMPEVGYKVAESFMAHHSGYRFRHFQHEVYGNERARLEGVGSCIETDYAEFFAHGFPSPPPGKHPYLMGMTSATPRTRFNFGHALFANARPRFGFKLAEQDVLQSALAGHTDEEIAQHLCLSLWTIKKRWQTLYDRVATVDQEVLVQREAEASSGPAQQRRRLLHYLSRHPEELRPYASAAPKVTPSA